MNWKRETIQDLKDFKYLQEYVAKYPRLMAELHEDLTSLKGICNKEAVSGGGSSKTEDAWINIIAKKDQIKVNHNVKVLKYKRIKESLDILSEQERITLDYFYIEKRKNHIGELMRRFYIEKSAVYDLKNEALRKLAISMYGSCED